MKKLLYNIILLTITVTSGFSCTKNFDDGNSESINSAIVDAQAGQVLHLLDQNEPGVCLEVTLIQNRQIDDEKLRPGKCPPKVTVGNETVNIVKSCKSYRDEEGLANIVIKYYEKYKANPKSEIEVLDDSKASFLCDTILTAMRKIPN